MSDTRSRPVRRTSSGKRPSVGGPARGGNLPVVFIGAVVAVVLAFVVFIAVAADVFNGDDPPVSPIVEPTETPTGEPSSEPTIEPGTQPPDASPTATLAPDETIVVACGDLLAPVDKQHRLPADCVPPGLQQIPAEYSRDYQSMRSDALGALSELFQAAKSSGYTLYVNSSYRDYAEQARTYNYWVSVSGQAYADRTSARPGHSEHQMGSTADVAARGLELEAFTGTPEAAWIAANAHRFGFVISYPDGKEAITGYAYEPWHIRFVGKDVAQQVKDSGLTLHEFLLR